MLQTAWPLLCHVGATRAERARCAAGSPVGVPGHCGPPVEVVRRHLAEPRDPEHLPDGRGWHLRRRFACGEWRARRLGAIPPRLHHLGVAARKAANPACLARKGAQLGAALRLEDDRGGGDQNARCLVLHECRRAGAPASAAPRLGRDFTNPPPAVPAAWFVCASAPARKSSRAHTHTRAHRPA